ncbi:MAG: DUF5777 family beta-barrel protein [Candidatus Latescibacterota bacterium]|nr:DUF5777 family beta-barrel protein [Candidatus Latescibacterota bacterium]
MKFLNLCLLTGLSSALLAQPSWRSNITGKIDTVNPFKATMTTNFPTSTMLYSSDWHYEISHRFVPPIREKGAFLGLDGGANMRMSIGYGIRDNLNLRIGRSSLHDNADLQLKYRIWNNLSSKGPSALALRIGIARNGDLPGKQQQARIWQYVAQLVYNIQWSNSPLRIGIVPSFLHNTAPYSIETQHSLIAGLYVLYYLNEMWGIWIESAPLIEGYRGRLWSLENKKIKYNTPVTAGISIETGGHVFYLFATNSLQLNSSQFLAGTPRKLAPANLHLGFSITRHL